MPKFNVHLAETRHFIIPVQASNTEEARDAARKLWRDAPTTGQWEISDTEEEIVSIMGVP